MIIGINCGHTVSGQPGCGAVGYLNESDETRRVGKKVMEHLREMGNRVYDCTNDYAHTTSENLAAITAMANAKDLDLFVSIHLNSGGGKGCEVFTYGGEKMKEAVAVCKNLASLGFVQRGVKDGSGLYVIRHTKARAMLVEVCFVDSQTDFGLYSKIGVDKIARAIAQGIVNTQAKEEISVTQYEELKKEIDGLKPMIYNYIDENMPYWARGTISKLKDRGLILGNEKGELCLTEDMLKMYVVMDRAGLFH